MSADVEPLYYDPIDPEVDADVERVWKRLRDEAPLYWNDKYQFFALSRYDDVLHAIADTDRFVSSHGTTIGMLGPDPVSLPLMIFRDPPSHTWHRKVVNRAFTPRAIANLEDRVTLLCNELLDRISGDRFDFVEDYGAIIPPRVILALVGFPEDRAEQWRGEMDRSSDNDGAQLKRADDALTDLISPDSGTQSALFQMLPELMADRRRAPQEDLLSVLVNTDLDEDGTSRKLTEKEIATFLVELSAAGSETVARLIGWIGWLLDEHPDARAELGQDLSLVPGAIEEILRYEAPSPVQGRWVVEDAEFQGQVVPRGSRLLLLNGAANRDERHFEDPDRFDIRRKIDRHVSFGYGAHFCIGAALARMEGRIALREVLKRYPSWDVDRENAQMIQTVAVRGYSSLPVQV